jgi:hypothetical protein
MKAVMLLGILTAAIAGGPAQAAILDLSQVEIIALAPRGADVRPLAMSVPAEVQLKIDSEILDRAGSSRDPSAGNFIGAAGATRR